MTTQHSHNIEAVIFDIGGVLIQIELSAIVKSVSELTGRSPLELAAIYKHPSMLAFEIGTLSDREFHSQLEGLLGCPFPYPDFCKTWNSIFGAEIESTIALMHGLNARSDLTVGILTNNNSIHLAWLRANSRTCGGIKHLYASNEIGHRKPNPEAFHFVLSKMGVSPQRAVFIDDYAENIMGARAVGMHGILATDPDSVRSGLAALGVFCADNPSETRRI